MNKEPSITSETHDALVTSKADLDANPADLAAQGKMMANLGQAKIEQTQSSFEASKGRIVATGTAYAWVVAIIAICATLYFMREDLAGIVRAFRGDKAPSAQVEPSK